MNFEYTEDKPCYFSSKEEAVNVLLDWYNKVPLDELVDRINNLTYWEIKGEFRQDILKVLDDAYTQLMGNEAKIKEEQYVKQIPTTTPIVRQKPLSKKIIQLPNRFGGSNKG